MKKKTKSTQETLVNFILDKSGSMGSVKNSTISGFNEYLNTLKKDGNKYSFSLTLFDTVVSKVVENETISKVKELTEVSYYPSGCTSLYDAVCSTISGVKEKKGQKVITIIMTDGQENSSREYNQSQMRALIQEREKKGNWTFVYLGANQDSYAVAQDFGISKMNTTNFVQSDKGMMRSMNTLATNTGNFACSATASTSAFFSQADQSNLASDGGTQGSITASGTDQDAISAHFIQLGKKSWEARKKNLLG